MKNRHLILAAALLVSALAACSDDDDKPSADNSTPSAVTINLDENLVSSGIDIAANAKSYSLPIAATGKWTATIDSNCGWASIEDKEVEYDGNKTIVFDIDENTSTSSRTTVLYVVKDDSPDITEITVTQRGRDDNGSGVAFSGKGLGHGADYSYVLDTKENKKIRTEDETANVSSRKFDPTKVFLQNSIFNLEKIEAAIQSGNLEYNAYVESPIEISQLTAVLLDSCVNQSKLFAGHIDVSVSFGFLQFGAEADFRSQKDENRAFVDYFIARAAPMYHAYLSEEAIKSYAEDVAAEEEADNEELKAKIASKEKNFKEQNYLNTGDSTLKPSQLKTLESLRKKITTPTYGGVFSNGFRDKYFSLYTAVLDGEYETADRILEQINDGYGVFYISGGNWGGSLNFHCLVDTLAMKGETNVGVELTAEVLSAVDISGEFSYHEDGASYFHNMRLNLECYGGSANAVADSVFALITSPSVTNYEKIHEILKNWIKSMESNDMQSSQAEPISFTISPIWNLFFDEDVAEYTRDFFLKKYASRGIYDYLDIMEDNPNAKSVEQMLNAE